MTRSGDIVQLLEKAVRAREHLFDSSHQSAFRLFNGFSEGYPDLTVDIYGRTFVINNYADDLSQNEKLVQELVSFLQTILPWLRAGTVKSRNAKHPADKKGVLFFGDKPDTKIKEHGVWYAINLIMNQDASFYLDTRGLRKWLIENMRDKSVLNTFAYTGSLGVAALTGGAKRVVQNDRNRQFLNLAKDSYTLNGLPIHKSDFVVGDFFPTIARLKSTKQYFDCVILDPPFFSTTSKGRVDLVKESTRLINKVRPLVNDGGYLVVINNALFVSGKEHMNAIENLCQDGYLNIETFIPVPEDCIGYHPIGSSITDPAPFNHSTKIVVLKVRRKSL